LILADLETIDKRIRAVEKELKTQKKEIKERHELYTQIKEMLEKGDMAYNFDYNDEHGYLKECHLLTLKPFLYIANVSEDELSNFDEKLYKEKIGLKEKDSLVPVCAKLEEDLAELSDDEAKEFLDELGITNSGKATLIQKAYETLGLETYFTAGEKEVRAWTYKKGMSAPQCAGVIHTDFEKGFICGDMVNWKDFIDAGGWSGAKEKGLVKMQGRDYIMQDGDVCFFKFSN
ncbi:redox-regulated ATPase YchF, partial [Candidatus Peregrinibacteria bacterium]|nr:redox-regulated ATPase YchF [Candidatus Peregrinibacteria bacterium]